MRHRNILGLFLILAIVMTSCTTPDPKTVYQSYVDKQKSLEEYKIVYEMELGMLGELSGIADIKFGTFKKGNKEKILSEISAMGSTMTLSAYHIDDRVLFCTKSLGGIIGDNKISCSSSDDGQMDSFQSFINSTSASQFADKIIDDENIMLEYNGAVNMIDRTCDSFSIEIPDLNEVLNMTEYNGMFGDSNTDGSTKAVISICLDRETGMALKTNISTFSVSELTDDEELKEILSITALSLVDKVDDSVFEIPATFGMLSSGCDDSELVAVIEPYKDFSGDLKINIYENMYAKEEPTEVLTISGTQLKGFETTVISKEHKQLNDQFSFEVCAGDECQSGSCYNKPECLKNSADKAACEGVDGCYYSDPLCEKFSCSILSEESDCKENTKCHWSEFGSYGYCMEKTCGVYDSEEDCTADSDCSWSYNYCSKKSCYSYTKEAECVTSELGCEWSGTMCRTFSCYSQTTQSACEEHDICKWSSGYCMTDYNQM